MKENSKIILYILILNLGIAISYLTLKLTQDIYTQKTISQFNQMKKPIVLINKYKRTLWYNVTLKDNNGKIMTFGNSSKLANSIGENYQINDTIKHNVHNCVHK